MIEEDFSYHRYARVTPMSVFVLDVETDLSASLVTLRLSDEQGNYLAANQARLSDHTASMWEGAFDTRTHVSRYAGVLRPDAQADPATAEQLLDRLGVFLGQKVLGPDILGRLAAGINQRTLLVRLPDPTADLLAAGFARVPWEIARPAPGEPALAERNVVVRALPGDADPATVAQGPTLPPARPVRVLLVFAEAPGSRPLSTRLEREQLLDLLFTDVMPHRRVEVEVLCHGVTRRLLRDRVQAAGGFHAVHWSGHGHYNRLDLVGEDGKPDALTGEELVRLFADAGGFIPSLVFLSACLSGAVVGARDWEQLRRAIRREPEAAGAAPTLTEVLKEQPGYTGVALALLKAGVPQVVAMRYEVSDGYARRLAERFYRHLLADAAHHPADAALALARRDVATGELRGEFNPVDHATPLVFGATGVAFQPPPGRSLQAERRRPRPHPLLPDGRPDLDPHLGFVGRGAELATLARRWLPAGGLAVALVQGLAGLGKTAVAAEAVGLWHRRFDWVLAFQSRPAELSAEEFYRQVDLRLARHSTAYEARCAAEPGARVFIPATAGFTGADRLRHLRENLLAALDRERVLVVLDNFETNLALPDAAGLCPCRDPEWDRLLAALAGRLPRTGSRVLVTCRHRVKALSDERQAVWLPLGPLTDGEVGLLVQSDDNMRRLMLGVAADQELARRVLEVSRGHPLILRRLAHLANDRPALAGALDRLRRHGLSSLPSVFEGTRTTAERDAERAYLEDVSCGAIDVLLGRVSRSARQLLWVATRADEPSTESMLAGVWSGLTLDQEMASHARMSPERLNGLPPELRQKVEEVAATAPAPRESVGPLLAELQRTGLLALEGNGYGFHELVRERVTAWMASHPEDADGRTAEQVWQAFGVRYAAAFENLADSGGTDLQDEGAEAGRLAVGYLVRTGSHDDLRTFVGRLVTGVRHSNLLRMLLLPLQAAADAAPAGRDRWASRTHLGLVLFNLGRSDEAIPLYEEAARECEASGTKRELRWITQSRANALTEVGRLGDAREAFLRAAELGRQAGDRALGLLAAEQGVLRVDMKTGDAAVALPGVERQLGVLRDWWDRSRRGESVPEAPDRGELARAYVGALDVAWQANRQLGHCQTCLDQLDEFLGVMKEAGWSQYDLTRTGLNRSIPLLQLGRVGEAREVLEGCLEPFRQAGDYVNEANVLTGLADIWRREDDLGQATGLIRQALAVYNRYPDPIYRGHAHQNLALMLAESGQWEESGRHVVAGLIYALIADPPGQEAMVSNIAYSIRKAEAACNQYGLPAVADLVARPEFDALRQFVEGAGVTTDDLQQGVDEAFEMAREWAVTQKTETPQGPPELNGTGPGPTGP